MMFKKMMCVLAACVLGLCALCACGGNGNEERGGEQGDNEYTASGSFYTLERAYEQGFLTYEEIMSIAYYHNKSKFGNEDVMSEDYVPLPKAPINLSAETELTIKNDAAFDYRMNRHGSAQQAKAEDFTIIEYDGTYGNCIAIMMTDIYTGYTGALVTQEIDGIKIYYGGGNMIKIWRKNQ